MAETLDPSAQDKGNVIAVDFARAARERAQAASIESSPVAFTMAERAVLASLFEKGRDQGIFHYSYLNDKSGDHQSFQFYSTPQEDCYGKPAFSAIKMIDDDGDVVYGCKPLTGKGKGFFSFAELAAHLDGRIDIVTEEREQRREHAERTARLGHHIGPLRLAK